MTFRAFKHWFRHEWKNHPSMTRSDLTPTAHPGLWVEHRMCVYPGCGVERVRFWNSRVGWESGYYTRCPADAE